MGKEQYLRAFALWNFREMNQETLEIVYTKPTIFQDNCELFVTHGGVKIENTAISTRVKDKELGPNFTYLY